MGPSYDQYYASFLPETDITIHNTRNTGATWQMQPGNEIQVKCGQGVLLDAFNSVSDEVCPLKHQQKMVDKTIMFSILFYPPPPKTTKKHGATFIAHLIQCFPLYKNTHRTHANCRPKELVETESCSQFQGKCHT